MSSELYSLLSLCVLYLSPLGAFKGLLEGDEGSGLRALYSIVQDLRARTTY